MSLRRVMVLFLIPAAPLLAKLVNNTVTVTASQSSTAQPDEAVFSVTVSSGVDNGLDDVVAAVSTVGITAANQVAVSTLLPILGGVPPSSLGWTFQLVVPFSKTRDTTASLTSLQKTISQNNSGLLLSSALTGTRVSGQQTPSCNLGDLVAEARAQAQQTATAAGLNPGAMVGLTGSISTPAPQGCSLTARHALGTMFGQLGPNSITITATRTHNVQPDQVLVVLSVTSGTTAGLDDITGALTGTGISGASFTGVYTTSFYPYGNQTPQTFFVWSFTLTAPLAKLSSTLAQLVSAHQTIWENNPGLTLTFYVQSMQVSQQLQQSLPCSQAALLADAQAQAKQVAAAAGVSTGPILSMAEGGRPVLAVQGAPPLAVVAIPANLGGSFVIPTVFNLTCTLTVQFQLM